ncbi:hypothetical protein ACSHT0_08290 [Tepidicaulis sp. LMO-SS28]|uniref:hypothetical protein n=1 Tax=Tepidicaulis sp. LMO-SS28 TaxID=3447455 RepID=UPI003EE0E614
MKPDTKILATIAAILFAGGLVAACEEQGPAEQAGEQIDEGVEEMGDGMEDAGDEMDDATQ